MRPSSHNSNDNHGEGDGDGNADDHGDDEYFIMSNKNKYGRFTCVSSMFSFLCKYIQAHPLMYMLHIYG